MFRVAAPLLCLLGVGPIAGFGGEVSESPTVAASTVSHLPGVISVPSTRPLPLEYRVLAKNLAMPIYPSLEQARDKEGSELLAELHAAYMALNGIQTDDKNIQHLAAQGTSTCSEAISRFERANALPKPPGAGSLFVESFMHGLAGDFQGGVALGNDAEQKRKAIVSEFEGLLAVIVKADALQQLLPAAAKPYMASLGDATDRIAVDFDESLSWHGPNDWFHIYNNGEPLEDCTILVELSGAGNQTRKNVHFIQSWPSKSWMTARYDPGIESLGRQVGRQTVSAVRDMNVTVWSPTYATSVKYTYEGPEKDKDIAERCKDLQITGRYRAYESGILWNNERGVYLTINGIEFVPKCEVSVTFRRLTQAVRGHWKFDQWKQGEVKTLETQKGQLAFDPTEIDLVLSFPDTSYRYRTTVAGKQ